MSKTNIYENVPVSETSRQQMTLNISDLHYISRMFMLQDEVNEERDEKIFEALKLIQEDIKEIKEDIRTIKIDLAEKAVDIALLKAYSSLQQTMIRILIAVGISIIAFIAIHTFLLN